MTLLQWSIVMFASTFIFYFFIYYSMFTRTSIFKFFLLAIVWILHEIITLVYGIATEQIGFVMIFSLDWVILIMIFAISGRYLKNENN